MPFSKYLKKGPWNYFLIFDFLLPHEYTLLWWWSLAAPILKVPIQVAARGEATVGKLHGMVCLGVHAAD